MHVSYIEQVQALTLLGEPRIILPIPAALNLCGIVSDGARVYVSDMDLHKVHVLKLWHSTPDAQAEQAMREAAMREELTQPSASHSKDAGGHLEMGMHQLHLQAEAERQAEAKSDQRNVAVRRVLSAPRQAGIHRVLGLHAAATDDEVMQSIRLAMRLLHPDQHLNLPLRGTTEGQRLEAAFKRVNNLKDEWEKEPG